MTTQSSKENASNTFSLRMTTLLVSLAILGAIVAAAALASRGRVEAVPFYLAFQSVCHQQADRSWLLFAQPLPVCVRCLGVYAGAFVAAVLAAPFLKRELLAASIAVCFTWGGEFANLFALPSPLRWLSGAFWGFTAVSALTERRPT